MLSTRMVGAAAALADLLVVATTATAAEDKPRPKTLSASANGLGIVPLEPKMTIVGGTGKFAGARGVLHRTRDETGGTLRYRYWL